MDPPCKRVLLSSIAFAVRGVIAPFLIAGIKHLFHLSWIKAFADSCFLEFPDATRAALNKNANEEAATITGMIATM